MLKRIFDILISLFSLILLSPILIIVLVLIRLTSKGPVFYRQTRVGEKSRDFKILKFRTMYVGADKLGLLTVGGRDSRITKVGYYLRKYKLDELPQLLNVFIGDMCLVGPRPEVRKYVDLYSDSQKKVLDVRPGITDLASIEFRNENEILAEQENPDKYYIDVIMPHKLQINLKYIKERSLIKDFEVIFKTFSVILK
jgi:lipopolysaccharide/colanic/teichoic acid biosynthesis glycosyltransferase